MNMNIEPADPARRFNPVFWIMWLLPAATVVAGFVTLAIALEGADRPLPADYHWEGERLDRDFERSRRAAALGLEATLEIRGGQCLATLRGATDEPVALSLLLTHGSEAGLDRRVRLQRISAGEYRAACAPLDAGKWRLQLDDDAARWSLRGVMGGEIERIDLRAPKSGGAAP